MSVCVCMCGVQLNSKKSFKNELGVTPAKISKLKLIVLKFMHFVRDKGKSSTRGRGTFVTFAFCGSFGVVIHPHRRKGNNSSHKGATDEMDFECNGLEYNEFAEDVGSYRRD